MNTFLSPEALQAHLDQLTTEKNLLEAQIRRRITALCDTRLFLLTAQIVSLDRPNLHLVHRFRAHSEPIRALCWSKDLNHLVLAAHDGHMIVWNLKTKLKEHFEPLELEDRYVYCTAILDDNRFVACGGLGNNVTVFRTKLGQTEHFTPSADSIALTEPSVVCRFKGHEDLVLGVVFLPTGDLVLVSNDRQCLLWDIGRGTKKRAFADALLDITDVAASPTHPTQFLTSLAEDSCIRLHDTRENANDGVVEIFGPAGDDATTVEYFPLGSAFAVGTRESIVTLYDIRGGNNKMENFMLPILGITQAQLAQAPSPTSQRFKSPEPRRSRAQYTQVDGVESMSFSRLGRLLFVTTPDMGCYALDVLKGTTVMELGRALSCVKVSPDGKAVLAASGAGNSIELWTGL